VNQIIIIHDQINKKYFLISGSAQIKIESYRKSERKGYVIVLDQKMPFISKNELEVGFKCNTVFTIRCTKTGKWDISNEDYEWLDKLFRLCPDLLEGYIESIVSQVKSNLDSKNKPPLYIFTLIDSILPNVINHIKEQLKILENRFPYFIFDIVITSNISEILDDEAKEKSRIRIETARDVINTPIDSPYPPEDIIKQRIEARTKILNSLTESQTPTPEDIKSAKEIIYRGEIDLLGFPNLDQNRDISVRLLEDNTHNPQNDIIVRVLDDDEDRNDHSSRDDDIHINILSDEE